MTKWISLRRRTTKISYRLLNMDHLHEIELDEFSTEEEVRYKIHYVISFCTPRLTTHLSFKSKRKRNKAYEKIKCFIPQSDNSILELESDIK